MKRFDGSDAKLVTVTQLMHEWVHHLQQEGWHIADASRGKASYAADDDAVKAMREAIDGIDGEVAAYGTHTLGEEHFREQAAEGFTRIYGTAFNPSHIAFTPGGQFGLSLAFHLIKKACPNGSIVAPCPWYLNHRALSELMGDDQQDRFLPVHLSRADDYALTAEAIEHSLVQHNDEIAAFLFCNPANPTGHITRKEEWKKIATIIRRYPDVPVICDEAFMEVVFDHDAHASLIHAAPDLLDRTFLFRSGTKALGLAGERLAAMVIPPAYLDEYTYWQSRLLGNPALSAQAGMAAALATMGADKLKPLQEYYLGNAEALYDQLRTMLPESALIKPQGGFYLLADLSMLFGTPMTAKAQLMSGEASAVIQSDVDIALSLLTGLHGAEKSGVAVVPASSFGLKPEDGMVRISFSPKREEVMQAAQMICQALSNVTPVQASA
ncbi:MAG: pyridoxal phosphate-dependent aminotransferase [Rickettsiales bacterium]|nr:pyridoxal phosphate-dependent aminotransferase [Rickettsiales bacterium]